MYVGTKAARDFHAPIRGQLPTPEASPPYNAPTFAAVPGRMATPESLSGEIQIGMALGSPGHPAPPAIPAAWEQFAPKVDASPETEAVGEPVLQRTKTTRRKLFAFFGGGKKHQDTPRVTIESSETGSTLMTSALSVSRSSSNATTGKKAPKYQPIIVPTNSEPSALSPIPVVPETRTPRFLRTKASEPVMRKPSVKGFSSQDTLRPPPAVSPIARSASPFLDIEIPDIKMERYSVMFGSVLNPQQPPSSLLARRQATLDRLKTINDKLREEDAKEAARQKRKTSPQPVKSPAFSLFPQSTPSAKKPESPRKLSPRMRSNTSPAVLPSPVQPTFEHDPMRAERGKGNFLKVNPLRVNPTKTKRVEPPVREQLEPAQPKVVQFDPTRSNLFLDSPTDDAEFEDNTGRLAEPFRPNIPEPQWQMISPPSSAAPSTASSAASSLRKLSPPSSVSSVQTHLTKPSVDDIDEADDNIKSAVEISIARQISISRQQRQLLRPLKTNIVTVPSSASASASAQLAKTGTTRSNTSSPQRTSPVKKLAKNEKLQETKSATPTLVHALETADPTLMRHRKSERVVLEAV